jgi:hypothetical protein
MEHAEFRRRYREAKRQAIEIASTMIVESLPHLHMPFISFPMRQPSTDLAYDERVFDRDDTYRRSGHTHPHEERRMIDYFWRDGFVPRWIDISVYCVNATATVFELLTSDVFTRYEADGCPFYTERPLKPWAAKTPPLPPGWRDVETSGRFSLNWHMEA